MEDFKGPAKSVPALYHRVTDVAEADNRRHICMHDCFWYGLRSVPNADCVLAALMMQVNYTLVLSLFQEALSHLCFITSTTSRHQGRF